MAKEFKYDLGDIIYNGKGKYLGVVIDTKSKTEDKEKSYIVETANGPVELLYNNLHESDWHKEKRLKKEKDK